MDSQVRRQLQADDLLTKIIPEEFAIYMNYVRKLGFEENPDYDFLRELFTKVLKTTGEQDDGVYDWMLLNNNKGWEAGHVCLILSFHLSKSIYSTF
jgi:casein kinase 1